MFRKSFWFALAAMLAAASLFAGGASAATPIGDACQANTVVISQSTANVSDDAIDGITAAAPTGGVITSWTVRNTFTEFPAAQKLKVYRPAPGKRLTVVGESDLHPIAAGVNTFATRIPVAAGDVVGLSGYLTLPTQTWQGSLICRETHLPGDELWGLDGDPPVGATVPPILEDSEFAVPVTATVEPDADGDGFGDETQDSCPTDASTHGPCPVAPPAPAPPAPTRLDASATAAREVVTVAVTASASASVTVGGTVRAGKGRTAKLYGGTWTVAPGTIAKFQVRLPTSVVAELHQMPRSRKLPVSLVASASGATAAKLRLRLPGEKVRRSR
jgi:hypothetical protein